MFAPISVGTPVKHLPRLAICIPLWERHIALRIFTTAIRMSICLTSLERSATVASSLQKLDEKAKNSNVKYGEKLSRNPV